MRQETQPRDAFVQMQWLGWPPKTRPCSTCYHSDLRRSRLLVGVPNIWGAPGPRPLSWSVPDTLQSCPSPHGNVTISNLMTVVQMLQTYIWRSARKLGFSRPAFQGHWNWHWSIGYLWLPINDPQQPWTCLVPFPRYCEIL